MSLVLGMVCVQETRRELRQCLQKRCPKCTHNNDLGGLNFQQKNPVLPLCAMCETPLWKWVTNYVKWATIREVIGTGGASNKERSCPDLASSVSHSAEGR
jgi:hypothetical protein